MLKQITPTEDIVNLFKPENLDKVFWKQDALKQIQVEEKVKVMKDYLTNEEMNDLLFVSHLLEINTKMGEKWLERENLLEDEHNFVKMAVSYSESLIKSVLKRMPTKEVEKFLKRAIKARKEPVRIIDNWMENRVMGTYETEYEVVKIERPQLEKLAYVAIQTTCRDCTKKYSTCELYDILEDNLVPRCEQNNNCAYSYISEEMKRKREEKKQAKLESKNKTSKRSTNKKRNRFDEDEEIIEYNFEESVVRRRK